MSSSPRRRSGGRVANSIVALSSAAVLAVYSAGYVRTRSAAQRFADEAADRRRPVVPAPAMSVSSAPALAVSASSTPLPESAGPAALVRSAPPRSRPPTSRRAVEAKPAIDRANPSADSPVVSPTIALPLESGHGAELASVATAVQTPAMPTPTAVPLPTPSSQYKDGRYYGWGTSRHGDIQAGVVIEDGKIVWAGITDCQTRYPCSVIAVLPAQVIARQSAEVDFISGATQSTNAFYYAILEALKQAK